MFESLGRAWKSYREGVRQYNEELKRKESKTYLVRIETDKELFEEKVTFRLQRYMEYDESPVEQMLNLIRSIRNKGYWVDNTLHTPSSIKKISYEEIPYEA